MAESGTAELLRAAQAGDRPALAALARSQGGRLHAIAFRVTRDAVWPMTSCRS